MTPASEIPRGLLPHREQYPPFVNTPEERERYDLCHAIVAMITGREDFMFARSLYMSDMPTGQLGRVGQHHDGHDDADHAPQRSDAPVDAPSR